jgi:hypothetical protein
VSGLGFPIADFEKSAGRVGALGLHSFAVYLSAVHISPWLVSRWFAYVAPLLHVYIAIPPGDWYLRHFEIVTVVPAVLAGYIVARSPASVATWAWGLPSLVLLYQMVQYHEPSSVLVGSPMSAVRYFFDIQRSMPSIGNPTANDPARALAQLLTTAPFYAGVAYSLGAWSAKQKLIAKFFGSRK